MQYHRTRKPAWELKAGDIIEQTLNGVDVLQPILRVRRMLFTGEFEGQQYRNAPQVVIEFLDPPAVYLTAPGDRPFNVLRKRERAT